MKKIALATAAFTLAFSAAQASANNRVSQTIAVDISDLNLASPADRLRAERRVKSAIRTICHVVGERTVASRQAEAQCRQQALDSIGRIGE